MVLHLDSLVVVALCGAALCGVALMLAALLRLMRRNHRLAQQLRQQALTDVLTGLPSRRALPEAHARLSRDALAAGEQLAVLMLDLDHLRQVNQRFGHAMGDAVLQHAAQLLKTSLRSDALALRFGGEEFVVLARVPHLQAARAVAEGLRALMAQFPARSGAHTVPLTVSVGLSLWRAAEPVGMALARADIALARAKDQGRNRVACGLELAA